MTKEQIREQFPDATEEQITALLNINGVDIEAEKRKSVDPKELKRLQGIETEYNKLKEADLTDAEKIQKALADAEASKTEFARKSNKLDVEKILVAAGLTEDDYKDLIDTLVSDDAEKSKAAATALAGLVSKQKETAAQKTKEEMMDNTQLAGGDKGESDETKSNAEKIAEKFFGAKKDNNDILSHYVGGNANV